MKTFRILIFLGFLLSYATFLWGQDHQQSESNDRKTIISGHIGGSVPNYTLVLILHGQFFTYSASVDSHATQILQAATDKKGNFKFIVHTGTSPFHFSLLLSNKKDDQGWLVNKPAVANYLIEPGDSVAIRFDDNSQYFSGKGYELLQAQFQIAKSDKDDFILKKDAQTNDKQNLKDWLNQKDSLLKAKLGSLQSYSSILSPIAYSIIRADVVGSNRAFVYSILIHAVAAHQSDPKMVSRDIPEVMEQLQRNFADLDQNDPASLSPKYVFYLYQKIRLEQNYNQIINGKRDWDNLNYFSLIATQYRGALRDKVLSWWLTLCASVNDLQPDYVSDALSVMKTPRYIKIVEDLKSTYAKGQPVTDYDFKDSKGRVIHLADFKGKVVLVDLWFSGCTGCVHVAANLPEVETAFKNRHDIQFVSISIDKDQKLWMHSIDPNPNGKHYTHFTTSSTKYLYTGGSGDQNDFIRKYVPNGSYPSLLIIDKKGRIYSASPSRPVNPELCAALIKQLNEALTSN